MFSPFFHSIISYIPMFLEMLIKLLQPRKKPANVKFRHCLSFYQLVGLVMAVDGAGAVML